MTDAFPIGQQLSSAGRLVALLRKVKQTVGGGSQHGQVGRAALTAFAIRVVSAGVAYLSQVIMARWMGSFDYGVFVWVWVWVLILGGLSSLGLQVAAIRFVPEYLERSEMALLRGTLLVFRAIPVAVSTGVMALSIVGLYVLGDRIDSRYLLPLYLALTCLPLYALTDVQDGIGRGRSWIGLGLIPPYVLRPLLILLGMAAARLLGLPMTATTAAGSAVVATWLTGIVQLGLMERKLARELSPGPREIQVRMWLATSLPICFISACELVLQNVDVLVLTRYVDASLVGVYFAALKTISLISFVNYAVGSAFASRLSALKARGDHAGLEKAVRLGATWSFWPSLAGAAVLLLLGKPLLAMFGAEFTSGYPTMFLLAVGFLVRSVVGPAEFVLRMLGEQNMCAVVLGVTALVDMTLCVMLVPQAGPFGAAAANAISMSLAALLFYNVARRRLGIDVSAFGRLRGA